MLLAKAFGVTTDWLLSEEAPKDEDTSGGATAAQQTADYDARIDAIPGVIGRILRRYGWLGGIYLAVVGIVLAIFGSVVHAPYRRLFQTPGITDENIQLIKRSGVYLFSLVVPILGIALLIAGIVLAVVLKKRSKK